MIDTSLSLFVVIRDTSRPFEQTLCVELCGTAGNVTHSNHHVSSIPCHRKPCTYRISCVLRKVDD